MKTVENRDGWTPERDGLLTQLWDEGLTGSQIAEKMGATRSSILARARRIRLKSRVSFESKASTRPRKKRNVTKFNFASGREAGREPLATIAKELYVYRETIVTPEAQRLSFEALVDGRCKYAHGDTPPYTFCGAKAAASGGSWCETHLHAVFGTKPAQSSENLGELEPLQKVQELEGAA